MKEVISSMEGNNHIAPSSVDGKIAGFSTSLQPRPSTLKRPTLVAVGGISSTFILDSVDAFCFVRRRCLTCPPMPVNSLMWFSAAVANNTIIITGGIRVSYGLYAIFFALKSGINIGKCSSNILLCIRISMCKCFFL